MVTFMLVVGAEVEGLEVLWKVMVKLVGGF